MNRGQSLPLFRRPDGTARVVLPLRSWLLATHFVVFFLPIVVLVGSGALARDLRNQTRWDLENQAALLAMVVQDHLDAHGAGSPGSSLAAVSEPLSSRLRAAKEATWSGIQLVDASGIVVASSGRTLGADLSSDPEVQAALAGEPATATRPRARTRHPLSSPSRLAGVRIFVAVPVEVSGRVVGALVLSRTPREEIQTLYQMAPGALLAWTVVSLMLTLGGAFYLGFLLTRGLGQVAEATGRISEGSFAGVHELESPMQSHVRDVAALATSVGRMSERLQHRLAYISEFASNVSHEFKTPLATLRGTVELLAEDDEMPIEQRQRFLDNAQSELLRLQRLVDGLLLLARAEEGRDQVLMDLGPLLREFEAPEVTVQGQAGWVHANPVQLGAVLDNLVNNAHIHGLPPVRIQGFIEDRWTGFEVLDCGPGISEPHTEKVFDRFFTTNREQGGTGLGLALVRAVIESHEGEVHITSRPGEMAVLVKLPRVVVSET